VAGSTGSRRRPGLADALVEVGAAEGEPAVERLGVAVVGAGLPVPIASAAESIASWAAVTPVRRARKPETGLAPAALRLLGRCPTARPAG
jgi:hypothetical protein